MFEINILNDIFLYHGTTMAGTNKGNLENLIVRIFLLVICYNVTLAQREMHWITKQPIRL